MEEAYKEYNIQKVAVVNPEYAIFFENIVKALIKYNITKYMIFVS